MGPCSEITTTLCSRPMGSVIATPLARSSGSKFFSASDSLRISRALQTSRPTNAQSDLQVKLPSHHNGMHEEGYAGGRSHAVGAARDKIRKLAEADKRSLASYITIVLEQHAAKKGR